MADLIGHPALLLEVATGAEHSSCLALLSVHEVLVDFSPGA